MDLVITFGQLLQRDEMIENNNNDGNESGFDQNYMDEIEKQSNMSPSDTTSESSCDTNNFNNSNDDSNIQECPSSSSASTTSSVSTASPPIFLEPINCPCTEHKGKLLLDIELPITVEGSFQLLFTENDWIKNFEESLKRSEKKCSSWKDLSSDKRERKCQYSIDLDKTFGPKSSDVTEIQTCTLINSINEGYIVNKVASNENIPYSDCFIIECSYCVTRLNYNSCRLKIHGCVTFKKYVFTIIKSVIEKSTISGLNNYYNSLQTKINKDIKSLQKIISKIDDKENTVEYEDDDDEEVEEAEEIHQKLTTEEDKSINEELAENKSRSRISSLTKKPKILSTNKKTVNKAGQLNDERKNNIVDKNNERTTQIESIIFLLKSIFILIFFILIFNVYFNFKTTNTTTTISTVTSRDVEIDNLKALINNLEVKLELIQNSLNKMGQKVDL